MVAVSSLAPERLPSVWCVLSTVSMPYPSPSRTPLPSASSSCTSSSSSKPRPSSPSCAADGEPVLFLREDGGASDLTPEAQHARGRSNVRSDSCVHHCCERARLKWLCTCGARVPWRRARAERVVAGAAVVAVLLLVAVAAAGAALVVAMRAGAAADVNATESITHRSFITAAHAWHVRW